MQGRQAPGKRHCPRSGQHEHMRVSGDLRVKKTSFCFFKKTNVCIISRRPSPALLLSYCDPGAQDSQLEVLNAAQPGVVLLRVTGVTLSVATFSDRVVLTTAGASVVWLSTIPRQRKKGRFDAEFLLRRDDTVLQFKCNKSFCLTGYNIPGLESIFGHL